jgi:transposase InsO family protein
MGEVSYRLR